MNGYLGIDVGSISTKGVIIDDNQKIIASSYIWTKGDPISAVKELLSLLEKQIDTESIIISGIGTTGSARKLIGSMLDASVVKNEITAHATGTLSIHPDYAMNTLCAAGTGSFLSSQSERLGVDVKDFGEIATKSKHPAKIAARCTVFAESDLVHKMQIGYSKEDIIAGLCNSVVSNYLNNVGKGKKIIEPIIFQGGVSKNIGVKKAFEEKTGYPVTVDENGHLMGALGVAILSMRSKKIKKFSFSIKEENFETKGIECNRCPNHCEIICVRKNKELIDSWGNRCENGTIKR